MSFVCEPTGHLVGQFRITPAGSGFKARDEFSILASSDEWFAPIAADVGPDGALWVLDWYNIIVQHNPIPPGFEKGKGNAYVTPLRDKRHGRAYRMVWTKGQPSQAPDLAKASPAELVEALKSDNQLWRMHAQRLLVERKNRDVLPALLALAADTSLDKAGLNPAAVHALWTAQGLGAFDGDGESSAVAAATGALAHPSAGVRKAALDVLPRTARSADTVTARKLASDPDARVRKSALLALSEMPPSDPAGAAAFAALAGKDSGTDRGLSDAATIAAARHDAGFLKAVFAAYGAGDAKPQAATREQAVNLIPNPSFEEGQGQKPLAWSVRGYSGPATHEWIEGGRTGSRSLRIRSERGADSSWFTDVRVEPDTDYRLSAWVKTEGVSGAMGALLNVHGTEFRTNAITGTSADWRRVEVTFNSGSRNVVSINCLFGGWGSSRGTAWYDDLELVPAPAAALPGPLGRAVSIVTSNYARRAPADSVVATLAALKGADGRLAQAVVQGLADGWPDEPKTAPKLNDNDVAELKAVMASLPAEARERLVALAGRWGREDLVAEHVATLAADLLKQLAATSAPDEQRVLAARRLVALDGSVKAVNAVLEQITPAAPPATQADLVEALTLSRDPAAGKAVISKWPTFTPTAQRAATALLLRKPEWTAALLDGIDSGVVNARDLRAEHWQVLKASPEPKIASRAAALEQVKGREPNADKKKLLDSLAPLAQKAGDVAVGRVAYEKNCAVCHTLEGKGGKVGPDLTGIGARPKSDLLAEVIDPNRSVEGTYRQWIVQTKDEVATGRLLSESRTSIELIDAAGKTHVFDRQDIKRLKASDLSVMPEGFEQLPKDDIAGILEYLSTSKVKH
jgi:putative heme-binding domain-containing protein